MDEEKDFNKPMRDLLAEMSKHLSDYSGYIDDNDLGNIEDPHWIVE